jgi:hypothetical protein
MILYLAILNFLLGAFDAYVTRRHIARYGVQVESNQFIVWLSTRLGPELAAIIGILCPTALWTLLLGGIGASVPLAILVGYNLRRFVLRLSTLKFELDLLKLKKKLASGEATLPSDSNESKPEASSSKWKDYTPTDCK